MNIMKLVTLDITACPASEGITCWFIDHFEAWLNKQRWTDEWRTNAYVWGPCDIRRGPVAKQKRSAPWGTPRRSACQSREVKRSGLRQACAR